MNHPRPLVSIAVGGTVLAVLAAAVSLLAYARRPYYMAVLLPLFLVLYLLLAWVLYLRDDGLSRRRLAAGSTRSARRALVLAAAELAVLSVLLYFLAGVGGRYYR